MKYSDICAGQVIIHVVGGQMNEDLAKNIGKIADWFIENDITLLWGDDYDERKNPNHPVAALEKAIIERKGRKPIRCLVLGEKNFETAKSAFVDPTKFEPVYDDSGILIGYKDLYDEKYTAIYSPKQQDRQKAYYNNADALMVLNGGLGAAYEIPSAFLYTLSGDVRKGFKLIVIDDPESKKYGKLIEAYLNCGGCTSGDFSQIEYHDSAAGFIAQKKREERI